MPNEPRIDGALEDGFLDSMRLVGDPVLDPLVAEFWKSRRSEYLTLLRNLFQVPGLPREHPLVHAFLSASAPPAKIEREVVDTGQRLFELWGPEALLVLGSYCLPLAYAAGNGVQVIARSRRLKDDPVRRLCDTAQMVIDVMQPGGLEPEDIGWRSTQKVRLIHALIRHHVQCDPERPWQETWGVPINQEDLTGTLLTFSAGVLHGLRIMGVPIAQLEADAYVKAWCAVGRLLGLDERLLPPTEAVARDTARRIGARQFRATPEGRELARELLDAVETLLPIPGYAASLSRFFLTETMFGIDVADLLALPGPNWTRWLVALRGREKRFVLRFLDRIPGARVRRSFLATRFAQAVILHRRPPGAAPFEIPQRRALGWGLSRLVR